MFRNRNHDHPMNIAQIILPWIALPPALYGGTERIVWSLTEGLVRRGHDVTLFAAGDSKTSARLDYLFLKSLGLQEQVKTALAATFDPLRHVAYAFGKAKQFDIIHSHAQYLGLPFASLVETPTVHTFHRVYDGSADEVGLLEQFKDQPFVSISDSQRRFDLNFIATVYNGIDAAQYPFEPMGEDYLFWTGRLVPKKGVVEAIGVARRLGRKLKIAGVVHDGAFFEKEINPLVDGEHVEYYGELTHDLMVNLYRHARAVLFPISWEEPFGLVMAESMACGTPVVAYNRGSVPEVVVDGETGFIVEPEADGIDGLCDAIQTIMEMPEGEYRAMRQACRRRVEDKFTVQRMVEGYENVYSRCHRRHV